MRKFTVEAPTRVDLAGGTLDLWPIHRMLDRKATVNIALALLARTTVVVGGELAKYSLRSVDQQLEVEGGFSEVLGAKSLPLHRLMLGALWSEAWGHLEIRTHCQSPQGAGLGGSSSLAITLARSLGLAQQVLLPERRLLEGAALVSQAQDIEATCLCSPTGIQDYWAAVNGGITVISYPPGAPAIQTYPLEKLPELNQEVLVCYSGRSRLSGINNWQIYQEIMEKSPKTLARMQKIGEHSEDAAAAVHSGNWQALLHYAHEEWLVRTTLCEGIETEETRRIDQAACRTGAYFTRICGAGGGGVMAIFVPKEKREQVGNAVTEAGGALLATCFTDRGLFQIAGI